MQSNYLQKESVQLRRQLWRRTVNDNIAISFLDFDSDSVAVQIFKFQFQ
jgi:hypothetical protein